MVTASAVPPSPPAGADEYRGGSTISVWNPEDQKFWGETGEHVARRNLWCSMPALFLAFAVWMVWSTVVVKLKSVGFTFTDQQLFWLAALPGLSGATLRIFYSFLVPILGGRNFTVLSTATLLIPAVGIGLAVQSSDTPYSVFVLPALLTGFGGANFASSMSNISFFFPLAGATPTAKAVSARDAAKESAAAGRALGGVRCLDGGRAT